MKCGFEGLCFNEEVFQRIEKRPKKLDKRFAIVIINIERILVAIMKIISVSDFLRSAVSPYKKSYGMLIR
jgi:hypothetical protein